MIFQLHAVFRALRKLTCKGTITVLQQVESSKTWNSRHLVLNMQPDAKMQSGLQLQNYVKIFKDTSFTLQIVMYV